MVKHNILPQNPSELKQLIDLKPPSLLAPSSYINEIATDVDDYIELYSYKRFYQALDCKKILQMRTKKV
jgi:RAB protein geranylgeranyltransferase component A